MEPLTPHLERIRIVLVEPEYNGNLGQVARALRNFGLSRLALAGGKADPDSDEARWYARAEGQMVLDGVQRFGSFAEAIADCGLVIGTSRRIGQERNAYEGPEALFSGLKPWRQPWTTAIVFGREAHGLFNDELDLCHHHLMIPTDPACPSMNLSHAVALTGYLLAQALRDDQSLAVDTPEFVPASHEQLEAMYAHMRRVWSRIGYILTPKPDTFLRRWRRIFGRTKLSEYEVRIVRSLLHQTDWVAEVAGIPPGGPREAPPGFFDKHKVHLRAEPDEIVAERASGRAAPASGAEGSPRDP